jgi:ADP-ribose pyrophosphatase YjhB (NUDIX family)
VTRHAPPLAVHLLFRRGSEVLLLRRANTGYRDGMYSVPAGHVEAGESATGAACREALEEVGLELSPRDLEFALVMHRFEGEERLDLFFEVRRWEGEPRNCEPVKCDELWWYPLEALPEDTVPYVRRGIEAAAAGERYVEFGWTTG